MTAYIVNLVTPSFSAQVSDKEKALVREVINGAAAELAARMRGWDGDRVYAVIYPLPPSTAEMQVTARLDNVLPHGSRWPEGEGVVVR